MQSSYLRVSVHGVCHPAARLDLIGIQSPEFELFLKEWTANVGRIVELAGAVVIQDLSKDSRMTIEEVFV